MEKNIRLKLVKIKYGGESVGDDIRIEIKVSDKKYILSKQISYGTEAIINQEVDSILSGHVPFVLPINIKIVEEDLIFDDVGNIDVKISIDPNKLSAQRSDFEVMVRESRGLLPGKKIAIFTVTLEVSPSLLYVPLVGDGWLEFKQGNALELIGLPAFLEVSANGMELIREYVVPQEGLLKGKRLWVTKAKDEGLSSSFSNLQIGPAHLTYSISKKTLTLGNKIYKTTDFNEEPWKKGFYDIEIPDHPHTGGIHYPDSKYAKTWFRIGHSGDRYIHTGKHSLGCITMTETEKWDELCLTLLKARKGDGMNIGTLTVIN